MCLQWKSNCWMLFIASCILFFVILLILVLRCLLYCYLYVANCPAGLTVSTSPACIPVKGTFELQLQAGLEQLATVLQNTKT